LHGNLRPGGDSHSLRREAPQTGGDLIQTPAGVKCFAGNFV
jgi:hypothetical protein